MAALTRAELVATAEARVLYAAAWDRTAADEARALVPADGFAGRAAILWALITHHDQAHEPWPGEEPHHGPGRVLSILTTAHTLTPDHKHAHGDGDHDEPHGRCGCGCRDLDGGDRDPLLSRAFHTAVTEHGLALSVVAPPGPWPIDLPTAHDALRHAAVAAAAAYAVAALDTLAHNVQTLSTTRTGTPPCPTPPPTPPTTAPRP